MDMPNRHAPAPVEDLSTRLERERVNADRSYNEALTAVDRAIQVLPSLPDAPPSFDPSRVGDLNRLWNTLPDGPPAADRSLKGRLRAFIWRLVGPPLESQSRLNGALVDHINRNVAVHEETGRALARLLEATRQHVTTLVRFQSLLVQYLQTITAYVDTKDRSAGGSELRERLALTEQRLLALKRDVERSTSRAEPAVARGDAVEAQAAFRGAVDSLTYVAFEDRFRGSPEEIRSRVEDYLPILAAAGDVVDLGCGRGELLAALRARGVRARGVDVNPGMVELCRARGFEVEQGDVLTFLTEQTDASIGGLVAIQVVEHFGPAYLLRVLETAFHKMRAGAPLVIETINPACWMAYFETYLRDITHRQALHPDTLRHLVEASGFARVDVQFRQPVREADQLRRISSTAPELAAPLNQLAAVINDHADKLNARLFSSMDYVVIGWR
jgi:SAM-dependent methyltransferase